MTGDDTGESTDGRLRSRRQVLAATAGAAGVAGLAGCGGQSSAGGTPTATASEFANYPVTGDTVKIGVAAAETGEHSQEGQQLRAGYEVAKKSINETLGVAGQGAFDRVGGGLRGKPVELVMANTDSTAEGAREAATRLVDEEGAVALVGGTSAAEAKAIRSVADDRQVCNMIGLSPSSTVSGAGCSRFGFQELFNAKMVARALRPVLVEAFGEKANLAQLYSESTVGADFMEAMRNQLTNEAGWFNLTAEPTRVGTKSFEGPIQAALDRDPDVLVLNYYGLSGALALEEARSLAGDDVDLVVPLLTLPMARNAEGALKDVVGTVAWDAIIENDVSKAFMNAWLVTPFTQDRRDVADPSGIGHVAYFQLMQYAAGVEGAGSFAPPAVVDAIENRSYDTGLGSQQMRACDHQATRPVPVVRGLAPRDQSYSKYFELVEVRSDGVAYGCDQAPATNCSF
ncbi:ABC transporter substrate-binding protein [Halobacteriales archaeon Cl-PHB]